MSNPMYTAASGAITQGQALDILADNLANINTAGFKATHLTFREVISNLNKNQPAAHVQVAPASASIDWTQGDLHTTGGALDLALMGEGFFVVKTPDGERLTRNGAFRLTDKGIVANVVGNPLLGQHGLIRVPPGLSVRVDNQGQVWTMGGNTYLDKIRVVTVDKPEDLVRQGEAMFRVQNKNAELKRIETPVQSGALESANVKAVQLMTDLIWVQRAYEMYNRSIEVAHGIDQKTTSGIA